MGRSGNLDACSYQVRQGTRQERSSSVHLVVEREDVRVPHLEPSGGAYPEAYYGIRHGGHRRDEGFGDACLDEGIRLGDADPCGGAECFPGVLGIVELAGNGVRTGLVGQGRRPQVLF